MVKANELRVGNWVELKNSGNVKVEADNIGDIINNLTIFNLIPLTPEILEQCGFSHHARSVNFGDSGYDPQVFWYIMDGVDEFHQRKFLYGVIIGQFKDGFYYQAGQRRYKGIKITSLHQLQNLWHSLTYEELKVTFQSIKELK